jgi:GH25 family lysozyme M1 (1,4-beta-N-acetylmuramidase)
MKHVWVGAVAAIWCACGPASDGGSSAEPSGEATGEVRICAPGATVAGVDVSEFNGTVNWPAVKQAGNAFGIARISDSLSRADPTFATNWNGIKAAGMIRGAYQFFRPSQSASAQAQRVIDAVGRLGPGDLPAILDAEERSGRSNAEIIAGMRTWLDLVEKGTGKRPIIYTADFFWSTLSGTAEFAAYPLWVANYQVTCPFVPSTWNKWLMWQTGDTGRVPGIPGDTDTNVFNGTLADLQAFANGGTVAAGEALSVQVSREVDGTQVFRASGSAKVTSVSFAVDDFPLAAPSKDANGDFVLRQKLTSNVEQRRLTATGRNATGELVARGIALFDATDSPGVFIRQVGAATYEIGLDRSPAAVAAIEVRADGFLLTDSVSQRSRSTRKAVRSSFTLLGSRTFKISTFNADGTLRGNLNRTFSLE